MENNNFERLNWSSPVETQKRELPEASSIKELARIEKAKDEVRIELIHDQIVQLSDEDENIVELDDDKADEIDPVIAIKERRINDARNVFGDESFFVHLIEQK